MQVKRNQAALLHACALLPRYQEAADRHHDWQVQRGRSEQRTVTTYTAPLPGWFGSGWDEHIQLAIRVERIVQHRRRGRLEVSTETAWWISTITLSAERCQEAIRRHWSIENQFHYVRDVVLDEDACRVRIQPGILARLRSIALNCLRKNKVESVARAIYANALDFSASVKIAQGI